MVEKVFCHSQDLDGKLNDVEKWNISSQNKKEIKNFIRAYELGKITQRRGTNPQGSLLRYLYFLKVALENLKGESKKEIEEFLEGLLRDKIKSFNPKTRDYSGNSYALKSKRDILNILEKYLSWKSPSKSYIFKEVLSLKLSGKKNDIKTLTEEEIKKLIETEGRSDKKYMIAVLSSAGLRAEEFFNLRYSDVELPKGKDMFVKITIRNQFSKTEGRKINLYDKWVLPIVKQYLAERLEQGIKPEEVIFKTAYTTNKKYFSRLGKKTLGKSISFHQFRHSCATRLASKLNRQQLCIYFGWKFSSNMPDIYIQRNGVDMVDVESKFEKVEFEKQQEQLEQLKDEMKNKEKEYLEMFNNLKRELEKKFQKTIN